MSVASPAPIVGASETALDGGAISTAFLLDIAYVNGASYQWAHEWNRNIEHVFQRMQDAGQDTSKVKSVFDFVQVPVYTDPDPDSDVLTYESDQVKRRLWNIGTPMDPEAELLPFYSKLNVGGGKNRWSPTNPTGSYGMGLRASLLYWTDVMFISSVPGDGSYAIILRAVTDADGQTTYTHVKPAAFDTEGSLFVPGLLMPKLGDDYYVASHAGTLIALKEDLVHPEVREHGGFTALLLGKGDYTAQVDFDTNRRSGLDAETRSGLPKSITNHEVGGRFPIKVVYLMERGTTKEDGSFLHYDGTRTYYDSRAIRPLSTWTDRATTVCAPVALDEHGSTATAYVLPEDYFHEGKFTDAQREKHLAKDPSAVFEYRSDKTWGLLPPKGITKDAWLPYRGQGNVLVRFGTELYPLTEIRSRSTDALARWGVTRESVARRTLIIIDPVKADDFGTWGVTQNQARSGLVTSGGGALPKDTWSNAFLDNFPVELAKELAVRPPSTNRHIPKEEIERLRERFFGKKSSGTKPPARRVLDAKGDLLADGSETVIATSAGDGTGAGTGTPAVKKSEVAEKDGTKKATMRRPAMPLPDEPEFISADEWATNGWDPRQFCHIQSPGGASYEIRLNRGHKILANQCDYYWGNEVSGYFAPSARRKVRARILSKHGGASTVGAKDAAGGAVQEEIEYVYRLHALAIVMGAQAIYLGEKGDFDTTAFQNEFCDESLSATTALAGLVPQQGEIQARLNGLASAS